MAAHPDAVAGAPALDLEAHRRELTGYCYRMLGAIFEAEDAVQETMVRAWRSTDRLQSHVALRSWLYRIATNVCLDMLQGSQRRARPMDLGPSSTADSPLSPPLPEQAWLQPVPDARVLAHAADPADVIASRETIRLAFVAALQHLPPRQRAVLILRDVLRWQAAEVAELLETSVASVNSALQRARATLDGLDLDDSGPATVAAEHEDLFARYVDAFERYDISELVSLLHEDATFTMPPHELWLRGPAQVEVWLHKLEDHCRGSRVIVTRANGCPAFGSYVPAGPGVHAAFNLTVVEAAGGRIVALHHFLDTRFFELFGLPLRLPGDSPAAT